MVTGKRAFHGETTSDILAGVLKEEPDWSRTPAKVQPLLRRCLAKDPKQRLRDIGDAMPLLDGQSELAPARSQPWPWLVSAVFAIAFCIAGIGWWRSSRSAPLRPLIQLTAELSPDTTINRFRGGDQLAISPDGTRLVVAVRNLAGGNYHLVTRRLDQSEFAPLSGTEGANQPFFSPDGQWIAFFADSKLKKVPVQGGSALTLCEAPNPVGGSWGDDNKIIAALNDAQGILWRISSSGGAPMPATQLDRKNDERTQRGPQVLPGSQAILFTSSRGSGDADIDVLSFKTGERKTLQRAGAFGRYLVTSNEAGYLVYMREDTLFAAPFDPGSLAVTGASQPVLEDVGVAGLDSAWNFALSRTGTFVYASWRSLFPWSIFWLNSAGKTEPLHSTPGIYGHPRFSPDGKRLLFGITAPLQTDVWVKDLERGATSRLTSLPGRNNLAAWSPDGRNIVFETHGSAAPGMYWIRADGSGDPQRLTDGKPRQVPSSFSPDGKRLAYTQQSADGVRSEIWIAPVEGDRDHPRLGKAELFLRTPFSPGQAVFSPDGRWLAYLSNETGTYEVYVRPFPGPGGSQQISTGGGMWPIWSRNRQELFFRSADQRIMVAKYVVTGDSFSAGKPQVWSEKRLVEGDSSTYDLAPDGKRFAVVLNSDGSSEPKPFTHVTVLLNFVDELKRRVPAGEK
jgi:serine/threonine-protein kinase